jgi:hypothetical protein
MCSPTVMMAISAIQTASEISATNQAAEAQQEAAIEQQRIQNMQSVQEMEETTRKAGLELTESKREALREQATQRTAAAESGVAGASPLRNLGNVYMQEAFKSGSVVALQESDLAKIGTQSQADFLSTRSKINQAESKKSTGLGAALRIGAAAGQGYSAGGGTTESFKKDFFNY